jgi:hypothetical protein
MAVSKIFWWNRLSVRLTAVIAVLTLAIIGVLAAVAWKTQRTYLEAEVVKGAARFSDTIKSSTYHHMLADQRQEAYRVMDTIGHQEGIEKVRIFNKEGRVTFSTRPEEIGTMVDKREESCYTCHAADQPIVRLDIPSRSRTYTANDHRVLGMVTPIYNEESCYRADCHVHPKEQRVLGVVDIGLSLAEIDSEMGHLQGLLGLWAGLGILPAGTSSGR